MSSFDKPEDLPLGLMMQLGQDLGAMETFAGLDEGQKAQMIDYIRDSQSGSEAKERIEQVMDSLEQHQSLF